MVPTTYSVQWTDLATIINELNLEIYNKIFVINLVKVVNSSDLLSGYKCT